MLKGLRATGFPAETEGSQGFLCVAGVSGFIGAAVAGDKQNHAGYPEHSQL